MARSLPDQNLLPQNVGVNCSYLLKQPNGDRKQQSTATSYGRWRQTRQIKLTGRTPYPHGQYPLSTRFARCKRGPQIERLAAATWARTCIHGCARPTHWGHSGPRNARSSAYNKQIQHRDFSTQLMAQSDGGNRGKLTNNRYTQRKFKLIFSILF